MSKAIVFNQLIDEARAYEARTGELKRYLNEQVTRLHPSIRSEGDPLDNLMHFVEQYIAHVPEFLDAATRVAVESGLTEAVMPLLRAAEYFFVEPPPQLDGHRGLDALLDEAYLAHRLVEEVNDCYMQQLGQPLIPMDLTVANLIVHQLIGEPFANELDELVHCAAVHMVDSSRFDAVSLDAYRARLSDPNVKAAWRQWPCMSQTLGLELAWAHQAVAC
ncbi:hypothetical protein [Atopomonas sediminilitoris]|uniref:hypothetical protein n=1 Tax=Atopomonas sediminilitoris TaxID=2919919 RepID=UPI001F4EF397|nr:hypothetical protein [Atopomonas sediminilitoris]MCJ8170581.1 hypothetical protein [Atopomonas sediminilitoris]